MVKYATMNRLVVIVAAAAVLAGCGDRNKGHSYEELPDDAVMASVDGVMYTKADLERDCLIMKDLLKLAQTDEADTMEAFDPEEVRRSTVERFIDREVLVKEANRMRMVVSPGEFKDYQAKFAEDFAEKLPVGFKAIVEALGPRSVAFRANLKRDALANKVCARIHDEIAQRTRVTPSDAMREQAIVRRINAETAVTNAAICAAATNAWKSICAGNDFDAVGRKLVELRKDVVYAADCIETNAVFAKVAVGKVSRPLEVGNDLVIVRALGPDLKGRPHYGKISYQLYDQFVVPTVEGAMKELFENGVRAGYEARIGELRQNARITNRFGVR